MMFMRRLYNPRRDDWRSVAGRLVVLGGTFALAGGGQSAVAPRLPALDYRAIVAQSDLHYDRPVERSEEGMPLGNGRMGSLVWTTPAALKFQISRRAALRDDRCPLLTFDTAAGEVIVLTRN
jgi:hypothetical protein